MNVSRNDAMQPVTLYSDLAPPERENRGKEINKSSGSKLLTPLPVPLPEGEGT